MMLGARKLFAFSFVVGASLLSACSNPKAEKVDTLGVAAAAMPGAAAEAGGRMVMATVPPRRPYCSSSAVLNKDLWDYQVPCKGDLPLDWRSLKTPAEVKALWAGIAGDKSLWIETTWSTPVSRRCSGAKCQGGSPEETAMARVQPTSDAHWVHPGAIQGSQTGGTVIGRMELRTAQDDKAYGMNDKGVVGYFVVLLPSSGVDNDTTIYVVVQVKEQGAGYAQAVVKSGVYGQCAGNHMHSYAAAGYVDCGDQQQAISLLSAKGNWTTQAMVSATDSIRAAAMTGASRCFTCDTPAWESCPFGCCSLRY